MKNLLACFLSMHVRGWLSQRPSCSKHILRGLLSLEQRQAEEIDDPTSRLSWTPRGDVDIGNKTVKSVCRKNENALRWFNVVKIGTCALLEQGGAVGRCGQECVEVSFSGACSVEYTLGIPHVLLIIFQVGTALYPFIIRSAKGTCWLVSSQCPFIVLLPLFKYSHSLGHVVEEQTLWGHQHFPAVVELSGHPLTLYLVVVFSLHDLSFLRSRIMIK